MARPWPAPMSGNTIQVIGDTHVGRIESGGATTGVIKSNKLLADVLGSKILPSVAARIQVGDFCEDAQTSQTNSANAWVNQLPGEFYAVVGNHDLTFTGTTVRTTAEAVAAYTSWTNRTANWNVDLGFCKLIGLEPEPLDTNPSGLMSTSAATNTYLDTQLGNTSLPCVVIFHCPLPNTVTGDPTLEYTSDPAQWPDFAWHSTGGANAAAVKAILNAHTTAKVVLAGHTHSSTDGTVAGIVNTYDVGDRNVIAINASAVVYAGGQDSTPWWDPVKSLFLTFVGNNLEVRWRDHGNCCWGELAGVKVTTVAIPA